MAYSGQQRSVLLATALVVTLLCATTSGAQTLRDARPPAEFPPASYTADQYVDSGGCVFVRAGFGGVTEWIPRVTRGRQQLCGYQPTQVSGTTAFNPRPAVPNPLDTPVPGLPTRTAQTPQTAPQTMTLVQACEGRTGVQPTLINQNTGQPIDCGKDGAAQPVTTPPAPVRVPDGYTRVWDDDRINLQRGLRTNP